MDIFPLAEVGKLQLGFSILIDAGVCRTTFIFKKFSSNEGKPKQKVF